MIKQDGLSRSSHLEIQGGEYSGQVSWILNIPASNDAEKVLGLISGQQLVTSADGKFAAFLVLTEDGFERIDHNVPKLPAIDLAAKKGARILKVASGRVVFFGSLKGSNVTGIYKLTKTGCELIQETDEVLSQTSVGPFTVVCSSKRDEERIVLFNEVSFPISNDTRMVSLSDGSIIFLENMNGVYYAYSVSHDGKIKDWSNLASLKGCSPFALVKLHGKYFLAADDPSKLMHLGPDNHLLKKDVEFGGELEAFWQSPNQKTIGWLVSLTESVNPVRRLYVNGVIVYEGEFDLRSSDLVWSPNGKMFGAVIRVSHFGESEKQFIITPSVEREIEENQFVQELLVDDQGRIAATIIKCGRFSHPNVYMRPHDGVSVAWNLSWTSDGRVFYNSALTTSSSVVIMRTMDDTHLWR
jgi:hypothetical protein